MLIEALALAQWASFAMISLKVSLRFPRPKMLFTSLRCSDRR